MLKMMEEEVMMIALVEMEEEAMTVTNFPTKDPRDKSVKDPEKNDPCNYHGKNICDKDSKGCDYKHFDCLSDLGNGNYCTTGMCPGDDDGNGPGKPNPPRNPIGECHGPKCKPGEGGGDWPGRPSRCHNGHGPHCPGNGGGGGGDGDRSWWCKHHDCHEHHHSSTHFSDTHYGDVTVEINAKYEETSPRNLEYVDLIIGDVHDEVLDLSDKPSEIRVDNLDLDGGDTFAVCLANECSQQGDCTVTEADSDHSTEIVYLTVK